MKKYISILSLIAAFLMQSCERSDSDLNVTEEKKRDIKVPGNREFQKTDNQTSKENDSEHLDTGDDDDPPRDKQHWRIVQDTIAKV